MAAKKNTASVPQINSSTDIVFDLSSMNFFEQLQYEFFQNFTSVHTIKSYKSDIKQFFNFVKQVTQNLSGFDSIEKIHVIAYRNWLDQKEYAPKTINRKLSSVSSYMDFLVEKNLMQFNPSSAIKRPKQEVIKPTLDLTDEDIVKVLEAVPIDSPSGPMHRAVLYILFTTGIRKSELIYLKRKDLFTIGDHQVIQVKAKGGKILTKALHPRCVEILEDYINWMATEGRTLETEDWFFQPTKNPAVKSFTEEDLNKPLRPSSIDYILKLYCQKAGVSGRYSPHSARASYIGSALEAGQEIWKVSRDVGHSSVKTTEIYNKRRQKLEDSPAYNLGFLDNTKVKKNK
jgi:integrase/recombinase XerD